MTAAYHAFDSTDAAALSPTEALSEELRGSGLKVAALCPGTDANRHGHRDQGLVDGPACREPKNSMARLLNAREYRFAIADLTAAAGRA